MNVAGQTAQEKGWGGGTMVGGWREDGRREGVRVGAVDRR